MITASQPLLDASKTEILLSFCQEDLEYANCILS